MSPTPSDDALANAAHVAALRAAFQRVLNAECVGQILLALVARARQGHVASIRLILQYTVGKPGPLTDLDFVEWPPTPAAPAETAPAADPPFADGSDAPPSSNGKIVAPPSPNGSVECPPPSLDGKEAALRALLEGSLNRRARRAARKRARATTCAAR